MTQTLLIVRTLVFSLIQLYSYVMFAQAIMSWFVNPANRLYQALRMVTEPFVGLFRPLSAKLTSRMGLPIDLAFLFAVIALQLLSGIVNWVFNLLLIFAA